MERTAPRRVEVDHALPAVAIPGSILHELYRHARETFPEECCGLIIGDAKQRFSRVLRCRNEATQRHQDSSDPYHRDNRAGFYMSPANYHEVLKQAPATLDSVTAVYHSHVDAMAYLSEDDLAYAEQAFSPFPQAAQIVVGIVDQQVHGAGIFEREGIGKPFRGHALEAAGP